MLMTWTDKYRILTCRINPTDYEDYARSERVSDVPGLVLCEHYGVRGIRYAVTTGCALSVLYFYGMVRPRLAFADRNLVKLHHYFYPSAGYTTPAGLLGGLLYGLYTEAKWVDETTLPNTASASTTTSGGGEAVAYARRYASALAKDQIARECRAARAAFDQSERHRQDVEDELRKSSGSGAMAAFLKRAFGIGSDPVALQMSKLGFGEARTWKDFLEPYGLAWTRLHSSVHDAGFYKNYTGPVVASAPVSTMSAAPLPAASTPPANPIFTKEQVDVVVSRASQLRHSPDESRWSRSGGRFATYGIATTVLAWNSGGLLFRVSMGLGLGVVAGAMISATRLDDAFKHL